MSISIDDNNGGIVNSNVQITVGDNIVVPDTNALSNKALVLINSGSSYYPQFTIYVKPYLNHFGVPYQIVDVATEVLPAFANYGLIILGHERVYESGYPITAFENALSAGVGLYSLDPHLFDFPSGFNAPASLESGSINQIEIAVDNGHFITQQHSGDEYDNNDFIPLLTSMPVSQSGSLVNGSVLAGGVYNGIDIALLEVSDYLYGKVVRWNNYNWMFEQYLGPVYGMDDLLWRSMVWAARKPIIMMGLPPFVTMRVDDADGTGASNENFHWVGVANNYGIKPWLGVFNSSIPPAYIPTLKNYLDNSLATASPHAFTVDEFIFYDHNGIGNFDPAANCINAIAYFTQHQLPLSKFVLPHYYEMSQLCAPILSANGVEFIGTHMIPGGEYYLSDWLNLGPFRINRYGSADERRPVYYADTITINGATLFNCVVEIRDDGGYEWYPRDEQIGSTIARGIRHLKRSFNSMALASLFTHENYIDQISEANWNTILQQVTSNITDYNPIYVTTDYALQYIRAKKNLTLLDVVKKQDHTEIFYSAGNDMNTKCYYFTEENGVITSRFVDLPQYNGINTITVTP